MTRRGNDWTDRFQKIVADAFLIKAKNAVIDGEIVIPAVNGTFDFDALQRALRASKPSNRLVMYAFDLLYLDGRDLRKLPLVERKAMLKLRVCKAILQRVEKCTDQFGASRYKEALEPN